MALSDIQINDLLMQHTDAFISQADYQTLQTNLIGRSALEEVMSQINDVLSKQCAADKQSFTLTATKDAFTAQIKSDAREASDDQQEKQNDDQLKNQSQFNLHLIENTVRQLESEYLLKQANLNRVQSELSGCQSARTQINRALDSIRLELRTIKNKYPSNPVDTSGTLHTHPDSGAAVGAVHQHPDSGTIHQHPGGVQTPPNDTDPLSSFSPKDLHDWNIFSQEQVRLLGEQLRLNELIRLKEIEKNKEQIELNDLIRVKETNGARLTELHRQLDIEYPNRDQQRAIRQKERSAREETRKTDAMSLQQLSYHNRQALDRRIANKNDELDRTQQRLSNRAKESSYTTYLTQFETALAKNTLLQKNQSELSVLKQTLNLMKTYKQMEAQQQKMAQQLNSERAVLKSMNTELIQHNQQLQRYLNSNPALAETNKALAEANIQLNLEMKSAVGARDTAYYTGLYGLFCTGGSALTTIYLMNSFVFNPLFIAIPAAFALQTIISMIVALIYHVKQSSRNNQIAQNNNTIKENEATISQQTDKAEELSTKIIPELSSGIEQQTAKIAKLEQQLADHQHAMTLQLGKAQNVKSVDFKGNTFFNSAEMGPPQDQLHDLPEPSAPIEPPPNYDEIDSVQPI